MISRTPEEYRIVAEEFRAHAAETLRLANIIEHGYTTEDEDFPS